MFTIFSDDLFWKRHNVLQLNMSKKSKLNDKKLMNKVTLETLPQLSPDLQFDHGFARNASETAVGKEFTTILEKDVDSQIVLKQSEIATSAIQNDENKEKGIQSQAVIESLLLFIGSTYESEPSKRTRLVNELFSILRKYNFIGPPTDIKPHRLRRIQQQFFQKIDKQINRFKTSGFLSSSLIPYINHISSDHKKLSFKKELEHYDPYSNNFEEIQTISRGGFGIVKKARHRVDGTEYAIKMIQKPGVNDKDFNGQFSLMQREVALNAELGSHKNIVAYKTSWIQLFGDNDSECTANSSSIDKVADDFSYKSSDNETDAKTSPQKTVKSTAVRSKFFGSSSSSSSSSLSSSKFRSSGKRKKNKLTLFIQMELCGKNLQTYLQERNEEPNFHVDMNKELAHFKQILNGVQYIHSKKLIHRDLKPPNILFSLDDKTIKIADFGLAAQQWIYPIGASSILSTGIGTKTYAAPEQIFGTKKQKPKYDHRVDIYSLGIILFEMVYPMKTSNQLSKCLEDLKKNRKLPQDLFDPQSCQISNLILQMTEHESSKRPKNIRKIFQSLGNKTKRKDGQENRIQRLQSENEDLRQQLAEAQEKLQKF